MIHASDIRTNRKSDCNELHIDLPMTSHTVIDVLPRSVSYPTTRGQVPITCHLIHATQQTHSAPGSGCVNFDKPMTTAGARHLSGCAVCARSFWAEELFEMNLFTKPDNGVEDADNSQHIPPRHCRFAVSPGCAATVNKLLSAKQYAYRWPKIPKHELLASSITHPFKTEWKWLLHTRRIEDSKLDENGMAPPVHVCPALRSVVRVWVNTCIRLHNGMPCIVQDRLAFTRLRCNYDLYGGHSCQHVSFVLEF